MGDVSNIPNNIKNIIGQKFGNLEVVAFSGFLPSGKKRQSLWLCKCKCGKSTYVRKNNLIGKTTSSCGCKKLSENKKFDTISLIGKKFGKLQVVAYSHKEQIKTKKRTTTKSYWKCLCDCGNTCIKFRGNIVSGNTKSCGCLELLRNESLKNKQIQKNILTTGEASLNMYYGDYRWRAKTKKISFEISKSEFKELIFSKCFFCDEPPSRQYPSHGRLKKRIPNGFIYVNGIDRKDSDKGYEKDNCLPCCSICNKAKLNMPIKKFENWLLKLAKKYQKKLNLESK